MTVDPPDAEAPAVAAAPGCKSVAKLYGKWMLVIFAGIAVLSWLGSRPPRTATDDTPVRVEQEAEPEAGPSPTISDDQCVAEFQRAAAIDAARDDVTDLDNAMALCHTIEDWIAANDLTGAIEGDPVAFLLNRCKYGPANRHGNACVEVEGLYPSGLYDPPYGQLKP